MMVVTGWGRGADCPRPTEMILIINLRHILWIHAFWDEKIRRYSQVVFLDTCGTATTGKGSVLLRNIFKQKSCGVGAHSRNKRIFNKPLWNLKITYCGPSLL